MAGGVRWVKGTEQMRVGFDVGASDEDIAALAETRTSRAFMLLGRVTGAFD